MFHLRNAFSLGSSEHYSNYARGQIVAKREEKTEWQVEVVWKVTWPCLEETLIHVSEK